MSLRKNNFVLCQYGVFGQVCYHNDSMEVAFLSILSLRLKVKIEGDFTEGSKEL